MLDSTCSAVMGEDFLTPSATLIAAFCTLSRVSFLEWQADVVAGIA